MFRESLSKCTFISFSLLLIIPVFAFAENVKSLYPDCEVCPVVISYDGDEARDILGKDGMRQIMRLIETDKKTRKIDFDGQKEIGTEKDSNDGYELLVFVYKDKIAINSIQDGSSINIKTDFIESESHRDMNKWNPEIQLLLSREHEIKKSDNLDLAWEKMKGSSIYGYVNNSLDHRKWNNNLSKFLSIVLEAAIGS